VPLFAVTLQKYLINFNTTIIGVVYEIVISVPHCVMGSIRNSSLLLRWILHFVELTPPKRGCVQNVRYSRLVVSC
jgi:hypothetical protein